MHIFPVCHRTLSHMFFVGPLDVSFKVQQWPIKMPSFVMLHPMPTQLSELLAQWTALRLCSKIGVSTNVPLVSIHLLPSGPCCWHPLDAAGHAHTNNLVCSSTTQNGSAEACRYTRWFAGFAPGPVRLLLTNGVRTKMKPHILLSHQHLCGLTVTLRSAMRTGGQHVYRIATAKSATDGMEGGHHLDQRPLRETGCRSLSRGHHQGL